MAWWNPLSWFSKDKDVVDPKTALEADVVEAISVQEGGKTLTVEAVRDDAPAAEKYLFEVQSIRATGQIVHLIPKGDPRTSFKSGDRSGKLEVRDVLMTLEEAERLAELSHVQGGDGLMKTAADIAKEAPPEPEPEPVKPSSFSPQALAIAKVDKVLTEPKPLDALVEGEIIKG